MAKAKKLAKGAGLNARTTGLDAFRRLLRAGAMAYEQRRAAIMDGDDPDDVHQARVALRQMRSLVRGFSDMLTRKTAEQLGDLLADRFRLLGPLRDADVRAMTLGDGGSAAVAARLRTDLRKTFAEDKAASLKVQIEALLLEPARSMRGERRRRLAKAPLGVIASRALQGAWTELLAFGPDLTALSPDERHDFRKRGKDMRYLSEFFASLFPGDAAPMLKQMTRMQDALGHANDLHVIRETSDQVPDDLDEQETAALHAAQKAWAKLRRKEAWWAAIPV